MSGNRSHVVVVSQHYPPDTSGNASRIHDTCEHIADEGWDVTVLAPPPAFPHGQFERTWERKATQTDNDVTVYRLWAWQPTVENPGFPSRMAYYLLFPLHALIWLLFNYRAYDAIVTSSPPIFTGLAGLPFGVLGRKPLVVDVRDLWIDASVGLGFISDGGILERASRAYEGFLLRTADRVTVTTTVLGERLAEQYDLAPHEIVHLPNGVDTNEYRPTGTETEPTIVYTGNVGHAQALEPCVRAMRELDPPGATLEIVGDGDVRDELEDLVDDEGLGDRVSFRGTVPREAIPGILNEAAIGIAPLEDDGTLEYAVPTKAYEYMSCELPVVATGIGEIESLINDSGGGVFSKKTPERLADTFETLLNDTEKRESLGTAGREHVVEYYDREVVAQRLDNMLTELVDA
jgi:glycosyltransferase involved in cell wall biosynthesis